MEEQLGNSRRNWKIYQGKCGNKKGNKRIEGNNQREAEYFSKNVRKKKEK